MSVDEAGEKNVSGKIKCDFGVFWGGVNRDDSAVMRIDLDRAVRNGVSKHGNQDVCPDNHEGEGGIEREEMEWFLGVGLLLAEFFDDLKHFFHFGPVVFIHVVDKENSVEVVDFVLYGAT